MKKIGNLEIDSNSVLKNEELIKLRGGIQCCCGYYDGTYGNGYDCQTFGGFSGVEIA